MRTAKEIWLSRNPQHETNLDTGIDDFWKTMEICMEDYHRERINKPQFLNFIEAEKIEMAHHEQRWGDESGTPPHHFQMVLGFINGKLAKAIWEKDKEKFVHHLITIAAVAGTTHKYFESESQVKKWFEK